MIPALSTDVRATFQIAHSGAPFFRSWRNRNRGAVGRFSIVPHADGWTVAAFVRRPSITETQATAELAALRADYERPEYLAATEEYQRQRAARDVRNAPGYSVEFDPLTMETAAGIIARQRAAMTAAGCRI